MATLHAPLVCGSLPSCRRLSSQRVRQRRVVAVPSLRRGYDTLRCRAEAGPGGDSSSGGSSVEETTRKWGLEAGLWKVSESPVTARVSLPDWFAFRGCRGDTSVQLLAVRGQRRWQGYTKVLA